MRVKPVWRYLPIVLLISAIVLVIATPVPVHAQAILSPSKVEYRLLRGMRINDEITYSGVGFTNVEDWDSCVLEVQPAGTISGINVRIIDKSCKKEGYAVLANIKILLSVNYTGGSISLIPFTSVVAKIYKGGSVVGVVYFSVIPINFKEVTITGVDIDASSIDPSRISYSTPATEVPVGTTVVIYPVGPSKLSMSLSDYLSYPATVEVRYMVGNKTLSTMVTLNTDSLVHQFETDSIPLGMQLPIEVVHNNITVYAGAVDVSKALTNIGGAMVVTTTPTIYKDRDTFYASAPLNIAHLNGQLRIQMVIEVTTDSGTDTKTVERVYTEPGYTSDLKVMLGDKRPKSISGYYLITFNKDGKEVNVRVNINNISYVLGTGSVVRYIFYMVFTFILASSFGSIVAGLLLRRPDLQSGGVLMLTTGVLIFLVPQIIASTVYLLVRTTHVVDPINVPGRVNINDLGALVDAAIEKTVQFAFDTANTLFSQANIALGLLALVAAAGTVGGAFLGWLTAGAASIIIGQIAGALGSFLIQMAFLGFIASAFLKALAILYPIFINVVLVVLLFAALLQALFSMFTGAHGQVFHTVMTISMIILTVVLTPIVIATFEQIKAEHTYHVEFGPIKLDIPNIFVTLPVTALEIVFLAGVMVLAFQRMMATLSGIG